MLETSPAGLGGIHFLTGAAQKKEARARRRETAVQSVSIRAGVPKGWDVVRRGKSRIRIERPKPPKDLQVDRIWHLFHGMDFDKISGSGIELPIKSGEFAHGSWPVDVVAIDGEFAFAVSCLYQERSGPRGSLEEDLTEFSNQAGAVANGLRRLVGQHDLNVIMVYATENVKWSEELKQRAEELKVVVWTETDVYALQELAKVAGGAAKYQIYSRVLHSRKIRKFEVQVPALQARAGGHTYYCFITSPERLLQVAYVHHRVGTYSYVDMTEGYQRLLAKSRVREIEHFIEEGGFFPGSVIVNFKRKLKVDALCNKDQVARLEPESRPVVLTLPPYYGSAWVIDGQHRLYGYGNIAKRKSETIPVVAFEDEPNQLETRLFVEINEKQKQIGPELLWDLYEDLYADSTDPDEEERYVTSMVAKKLNRDSDSPFHNHILIPKDHAVTATTKTHNISLYAICGSIRRARLVTRESGPLWKPDKNETIQYATERLKAYFGIFARKMPDEWNKGDEHYFRTKAGVTVLLSILPDVVTSAVRPRDDLEEFKRAASRFLSPLLRHFAACGQSQVDKYRKAGGAGGASHPYRVEFTRMMRDEKDDLGRGTGFWSHWLNEIERKEHLRSDAPIADLLDAGESGTLEVKGSLKLDIDRLVKGDRENKSTKDIAKAGVLKAIVGLANHKGGRVLVGALEYDRYGDALLEKFPDLHRHGRWAVIGTEAEMVDWEVYQHTLRELIGQHIGSHLVGSVVTIERATFHGSSLCSVTVNRSSIKTFLDGDFFVRQASDTVQLKGSAIDAYWEQRGPVI